VAIKKFKETDASDTIKKICVRELKFLKMCEHENIVHLKESFRRQDKLHLVFEYVDRSLLEVLEKTKNKGIEVGSANPAIRHQELHVPAHEGSGLSPYAQHHPQRHQAREHARGKVQFPNAVIMF
jgi:serine/threonine protein kinase